VDVHQHGSTGVRYVSDVFAALWTASQILNNSTIHTSIQTEGNNISLIKDTCKHCPGHSKIVNMNNYNKKDATIGRFL